MAAPDRPIALGDDVDEEVVDVDLDAWMVRQQPRQSRPTIKAGCSPAVIRMA
jgi:hypothetical protein